MIRAARAYAASPSGAGRRLRFDVVACTVEGRGAQARWRIEHWCDAFDASD